MAKYQNMNIENIARIEMLDCFVVLFYFNDASQVEIVGNPTNGNASIIRYTGNINQQAAKFLKQLTQNTDQYESTFWWETLEIVEQFKVKIYEG